MNPLWIELAERAGVSLAEPQVAALDRYLDLLIAANERMNLTRITDRSAAEVLHVGDALTVLPHLPPLPHQLVDVGAGGGVPGIPLAIARPDILVGLIEATQKKAEFLRETIADLDLINVTVIAERAEDVGNSELRETFDIAIARAVGTMEWLAEWCLPLVKRGGKMLAMKGPKVIEELPTASRAIKLLGGGEPVTHAIELPGAEHHVIIEIPKVARSDRRYPRLPTHAKGRPLV